jgi:aspartate/glutamate racemase
MHEHVGIVACSAEGAALCYRTICAEGAKLLGAHAHPEVTLHSHSAAGCDAVALGCTEIPLIIGDANSTLPTLDSTRLLARAALERCRRSVGARP